MSKFLDGFTLNGLLDKFISSNALEYLLGSKNNNNNFSGYGGGYNPYGVPPAQPEDNTNKYVLWGVLGVAFMFVFYMMFNNSKRR
ncbi:hypothetical protein [Capnocytophaga cynodegmi]|uniref:Uncharacterized protein n=1 Tax=Capnocytophaga cynodegmi TaxID=28189 RepID=A0A0B7HG07_9FLAO|nr:hypothetical protein [Capnocytophaga cynodegmi]CEN37614.1 hypothetical protein CCYN2B_40154 [Capnocytophaga cynodegmi]